MNNEKFHHIILSLKDNLYRLALSIVHDKAEAEDIVQDVFLKLWSKKDEWNNIDNAEAYCYRSTKNLALDRLSSRAIRRTESIDSQQESYAFIDSETPHLQFIRKEERSIIYRCIDELSQNQQLVFQLREIDGLSYGDIANVMGISEDLVKITLFRARKKMKELLEKYNDESIWIYSFFVEEEKQLQNFFSGKDIPEDLQKYAPLFKDYKESQLSIRLDNDFVKRLEAAIHQKEKEKQYITIRIFAPVLKIAASILIVVTLGIGIYFLANENKKPYFAETYNDPKAAIKDATYALEKLSEALQKGEEVSKETFNELKNLNIDWTALDSMDVETESEAMIEPNEKENLWDPFCKQQFLVKR